MTYVNVCGITQDILGTVNSIRSAHTTHIVTTNTKTTNAHTHAYEFITHRIHVARVYYYHYYYYCLFMPWGLLWEPRFLALQ